MKEVLSWLSSNYEMVILIAACVLDIILFLFGVFKKKVDPSLNGVLSELPNMIAAVEEKFGSGHGLEKKQCVIKMACLLYKATTGIEVDEKSYIYKSISDMIEVILETPQKKGK